MYNEIAIFRRYARCGKFHCGHKCEVSAGRFDVDKSQADPGKSPEQPRDRRSDDARADHRNVVDRGRRGVPRSIVRGLHVGDKCSASRRQVVECRHDRLGRQREDVQMRMGHRNDAILQFRWSALDSVDDCVTVFDRNGNALLMNAARMRL